MSMLDCMTLGQMIDQLNRIDKTLSVSYDFVHFKPWGLCSYRGYYEQLALGYTDDYAKEMNVGILLELLKDTIDKVFEGWKGGDYQMGEDTPMWVANPGEAGGTGIIKIDNQENWVYLITARVD